MDQIRAKMRPNIGATLVKLASILPFVIVNGTPISRLLMIQNGCRLYGD